MSNAEGRKTEQSHWDDSWRRPVRLRLPSRFNVGVLNVTRLLKRHLKPGDRYLELGCAPGKMLAWAASSLKVEASGLDYSENGISQCKTLFRALKLPIFLYHDDLFNHKLPLESFDVVASFGLIEHFEQPETLLEKHLELIKPGGLALIAIPNYGRIYGALQRKCDEENLALHNLEIMSPAGLLNLTKEMEIEAARAYYFGSMSPWILSFHRRMPNRAANVLNTLLNAIGCLQPVHIPAIAPLLVLEMRKVVR